MNVNDFESGYAHTDLKTLLWHARNFKVFRQPLDFRYQNTYTGTIEVIITHIQEDDP